MQEKRFACSSRLGLSVCEHVFPIPGARGATRPTKNVQTPVRVTDVTDPRWSLDIWNRATNPRILISGARWRGRARHSVRAVGISEWTISLSRVLSLFVPPRLGVQGTARPTGAHRSARAGVKGNARETIRLFVPVWSFRLRTRISNSRRARSDAPYQKCPNSSAGHRRHRPTDPRSV